MPKKYTPLNFITNTGKRVYKGVKYAIFTITKGGNKNYKIPKSGLRYRPVNGSPNGSKKFSISSFGLVKPKY